MAAAVVGQVQVGQMESPVVTTHISIHIHINATLTPLSTAGK